jgi:hypothetical protein
MVRRSKTSPVTRVDERRALIQLVAVLIGIAGVLGTAVGAGRLLHSRAEAPEAECRRRYAAAATMRDTASVDNVYPRFGTDVRMGRWSAVLRQCADDRLPGALRNAPRASPTPSAADYPRRSAPVPPSGSVGPAAAGVDSSLR